MAFQKGDIVQISSDNECYEKYQGTKLRVTHRATEYMKADKFFANGRPDGYHPGFDSASGGSLYDLETESGETVPFSLYDWELKRG